MIFKVTTAFVIAKRLYIILTQIIMQPPICPCLKLRRGGVKWQTRNQYGTGKLQRALQKVTQSGQSVSPFCFFTVPQFPTH